MTTIRDLLKRTRQRLAASETPILDSLVLLEWASGASRETILAEQSAATAEMLGEEQLHRFLDAIDQRATGRPVAYIVGEKEFYGRPFLVGPGVLIPRPDSETLVARAIELLERIPANGDEIPSVHDCCTGSGCIGLSIALEYTELRSAALFLTLSDADDTALVWARRNTERLAPPAVQPGASPARRSTQSQLTVSLRRLDLLNTDRTVDTGENGLPSTTDLPAPHLITANPPYLTSGETATALASGWGEPAVALEAGETGLDAITRLVPQAFSHLRKGGYLIVEHGADQASAVAACMRDAGFETVFTRHDLAGRDRITEARKPE